MKKIQLIHDKRLGLTKHKNMFNLSLEYINTIKADYLFSFRRILGDVDKVEDNINACSRSCIGYAGDVICYGLETDSPLAPILLWDISHSLKVGNKLYILGDGTEDLYLSKEYFKDAFRKIRMENGVLFEKIAQLPAEKDKGLERWSFCIPVGPEDATILNILVERILSFECQKEIILCGRPSKNFRYFDSVRIVGEDIPAPPIRISKKKNTLIEAAKYENLVILHDRVMLPTDFIKQMKIYGDMYGMVTLQSLYFDDYNNLSPIRYSDFNCVINPSLINKTRGQLINNKYIKIEPNLYMESNLAEIEKQGFAYSNALRYSAKNYPTGSLYIIKRQIAERYQLDNRLLWEQFEDVEYGTRLNEIGIVTTINPYTITQSVISRASLLGAYSVNYIDSKGRLKYSSNKWHSANAKHKPTHKLSKEMAYTKMLTFKNKYCPNEIIPEDTFIGSKRIKIINRLIMMSEVRRHSTAVKEFIRDVSNLLVFNKIPFQTESYFLDMFAENPYNAKRMMLETVETYIYLCARKREIFCENINDYYVKKNMLVKIGTLISAIRLNRLNGDYVYLERGILGYYCSIINSTPWRSV